MLAGEKKKKNHPGKVKHSILKLVDEILPDLENCM
jgi:hypothetical protein